MKKKITHFFDLDQIFKKMWTRFIWCLLDLVGPVTIGGRVVIFISIDARTFLLFFLAAVLVII